MDKSKIKLYCQFCLKLQELDAAKVPINREIKQKFQELTNLKVIYCSLSLLLYLIHQNLF